MKRFRFTDKELDSAFTDLVTWHEFVRRREAEMLFSLVPKRCFATALEIGAGDGGQSVTLAQYCERLVCTEHTVAGNAMIGPFRARDLPNVEYRLVDAQDLSQFSDDSFDLIFSSNVMEHVPDVMRCLRELRRVLRSDGMMIHYMPSRTWKVCHDLAGFARDRVWPGVHGTSRNNVEEFLQFGRQVWESKFTAAGFEILQLAALPFYFGHVRHGRPGLHRAFRRLTGAGNRLGLSATTAFVVRKSGQ